MNSWPCKGLITVTVGLCNEASVGPYPGYKLLGKDEGGWAEAAWCASWLVQKSGASETGHTGETGCVEIRDFYWDSDFHLVSIHGGCGHCLHAGPPSLCIPPNPPLPYFSGIQSLTIGTGEHGVRVRR